MNMPVYSRSLALAGIFQATRLVQQTARGEPRDSESTAASLGSIFNTDPANIVDVYGGIAGIGTGLEVLVRQLGNVDNSRDMELTRYAVTLIHLESKLKRQPHLLQLIRSGIETCKQHIEPGEELQAPVIAMLADIYKQTISTLTPRLLVNGEPTVVAVDERALASALKAGTIAAAAWMSFKVSHPRRARCWAWIMWS